MQFTHNNYRTKRLNRRTAKVIPINLQGASMVVERKNGRRDMLILRHLADRHVRLRWLRTIHSLQTATCDRVMAHLESFRGDAVNATSFYVAISRARKGAAVYIDSRVDLVDTLGEYDGAQAAAMHNLTVASEALSALQPRRLEPDYIAHLL